MLNWVTICITLIGGLAIFFYGMNLMSDGINKSAGKQMRRLLQVFTRNRFTSLLTGIISTSTVQSSSAVSVMVISLVKAGLLKFPQTYGILLGAGIGTTITAQIIAFNIAEYALLIIAIGFFLHFLSSNQLIKMIGSSILGFGFLFYGMHLMSQAMSPLRNYQPFLEFLVRLERPMIGVLAGFIFTAMIQSSGAFIGIIIVLASQGLLNLETGIALLLGSNVGTTVTAMMASFNAGYESKRVAVAFFLIKLTGVVLIVGWIPAYARLVENISNCFAGIEKVPSARLIANAHTIFNIFITIILIPFTNTFSNWVMKIIPERELKEPEPATTLYINENIVNSPAIALSLVKKELVHMGELVTIMLTDVIHPFLTKENKAIGSIKKNEEKVDYLRKKIAIYLTSVSQQQLEKGLAEECFRMLYINAEIEEIADIISSVMVKKAEEWIETEKDFSPEGKKEIITFHQQTLEQLGKTLKVIDSLDQHIANQLRKDHKKIRILADELKHKHFERLSQNITESIKTSKLHMELMGSLRMIHSHIANIMRVIVRNY